MALWTAFILGLAGSWHCLGMCGPIAIALPAYGSQQWGLLGSRVLYNSGRTITYTLLGLLFGVIGLSIQLAGLQQAVSIILGVLLLLAAFSFWKPESLLLKSRLLQPMVLRLKKGLGQWLKKRGVSAALITGMLNGLLPCGLVYVAVAGAVTTGSIVNSGLYMMAFGLGTFPLMLVISLFGHNLPLNIRRIFSKVIPAVMAIFAILLILRGLDLGIPFLSPALGGSCH